MDSFEALEAVCDMESFFVFVRALIRDRDLADELQHKCPAPPYGPDAGGWENGSISQYLVASLAWAEATSMGSNQGVPGPLSWRAFATFLYVGKIYE